MADWDHRFMALARHIGTWSKDRSRQVGCVIVGPGNIVRAIGFNGFPRGLNDDVDERHERPAKYSWTEHAERNAIYTAARAGISVAGCRMYLPWFPCVDCARAIVQSGIVELIATSPDLDDPKWGGDFTLSIAMLKEAGVDVRHVKTCGS
jgi:dCMP deaminase